MRRSPGRGVPVEVKTLVVLNDPAYGTERSYNGLRLAHALAKRDGEEVRVFLLGDSVTCALAACCSGRNRGRLIHTRRCDRRTDPRSAT
jgi:sulfur relay (sulfurtransferase) complex TusBCD TusD component (DsrE family)